MKTKYITVATISVLIGAVIFKLSIDTQRVTDNQCDTQNTYTLPQESRLTKLKNTFINFFTFDKDDFDSYSEYLSDDSLDESSEDINYDDYYNYDDDDVIIDDSDNDNTTNTTDITDSENDIIDYSDYYDYTTSESEEEDDDNKNKFNLDDLPQWIINKTNEILTKENLKEVAKYCKDKVYGFNEVSSFIIYL